MSVPDMAGAILSATYAGRGLWRVSVGTAGYLGATAIVTDVWTFDEQTGAVLFDGHGQPRLQARC